MDKITLQFPAISAPRVLTSRGPWALAKRLSFLNHDELGSLDSLSRAVFHTIAKYLHGQHGVICQYLRRSLAPSPSNFIRRFVNRITTTGFQAVISALCATGRAVYRIVPAWRVERHGLSRVTLCDTQNIHLAAAMSVAVMPGFSSRQIALAKVAAPIEVAKLYGFRGK